MSITVTVLLDEAFAGTLQRHRERLGEGGGSGAAHAPCVLADVPTSGEQQRPSVNHFDPIHPSPYAQLELALAVVTSTAGYVGPF